MATNDNKVELTLDEIVSTLERTSIISVVVEGRDDMVIYRKLEDEYKKCQISIFPVGGKGMVLKIFERLKEKKSTKKVIFISDLDMWVFSGVPIDFQSDKIVYTTGYSIENDIFVDANLENLLTSERREEFLSEIREFTRWYALISARYISGEVEQKYKTHPDKFFGDDNFRNDCLILREGEIFPEEIYDAMVQNYKKFIRGKSLFGLLFRQLKKQDGAKHSSKGIFEMISVRRGDLLNRLFNSVELAVDAMQT